jgi:hypothetical protein
LSVVVISDSTNYGVELNPISNTSFIDTTLDIIEQNFSWRVRRNELAKVLFEPIVSELKSLSRVLVGCDEWICMQIKIKKIKKCQHTPWIVDVELLITLSLTHKNTHTKSLPFYAVYLLRPVTPQISIHAVMNRFSVSI